MHPSPRLRQSNACNEARADWKWDRCGCEEPRRTVRPVRYSPARRVPHIDLQSRRRRLFVETPQFVRKTRFSAPQAKVAEPPDAAGSRGMTASRQFASCGSDAPRNVSGSGKIGIGGAPSTVALCPTRFLQHLREARELPSRPRPQHCACVRTEIRMSYFGAGLISLTRAVNREFFGRIGGYTHRTDSLSPLTQGAHECTIAVPGCLSLSSAYWFPAG
jgi:hypothetical protein